MTEALRKLSQHFGDAAGGSLVDTANDIVMTAGNAVAEQARRNAPKKSGTLANSIQVQALGRDTVKVVATAPYSGDVEFGTSPHVIVPKTGRVLVFQVGGRTVYARKVRHPGTKPEPYMRPALATGISEATEKLGHAGVSLIVNGAS